MCRHNNVDFKTYNTFNAFVIVVFNYNFQRRDEVIAIVNKKNFCRCVQTCFSIQKCCYLIKY